MIVRIGAKDQAAATVFQVGDVSASGFNPFGHGPLFEVANVGEHITNWFLGGLANFFKDLGMWLLQVGPDALIVISMVFCLGAICSIGRAGKWAVSSATMALILEIINRGVVMA